MGEKGQEKVTLPALDLPISRTGLLLYYPPLFKVSAEPGTFRAQEYENPTSAALEPPINAPTGGMGGGMATGQRRAGRGSEAVRPRRQFAQLQAGEDKKDSTQALLDSFKAKSMAGKVTGILPIDVSFPAFGPSIFLVSELTSENQSPAAEFNFQRDKKAGVR